MILNTDIKHGYSKYDLKTKYIYTLNSFKNSIRIENIHVLIILTFVNNF